MGRRGGERAAAPLSASYGADALDGQAGSTRPRGLHGASCCMECSLGWGHSAQMRLAPASVRLPCMACTAGKLSRVLAPPTGFPLQAQADAPPRAPFPNPQGDWLSSYWAGFMSPSQHSRIRNTGVPMDLLKVGWLFSFCLGLTVSTGHPACHRAAQRRGVSWAAALCPAWHGTAHPCSRSSLPEPLLFLPAHPFNASRMWAMPSRACQRTLRRTARSPRRAAAL